MKIAIYSRKSKFTGKGESIENQIETCHNCIKAMHPDVKDDDIKIFEDEGYSGKNVNRPQFQAMMREQEREPFDCVVVYRLDRISRSISDFSVMLDKLTKKGTAFYSANEKFDTSSITGSLMMTIAAAFAQFERQIIAERVRDNVYKLAQTGRWLGGTTPLGFSSEKMEYIDENGTTRKCCKLTEDKKEAALVRLIYDKFLAFRSMSKLETYLLNNGFNTRSGARFHVHTIRYILTNPIYCTADVQGYNYFAACGCELAAPLEACDGSFGFSGYKKTQTQKDDTRAANNISDWTIALGKHKGVIPSKDWIEVQRILEGNSEKKLGFRQSHNSVALLSGVLFCGKCGKYMRPKYYRENKNGTKPFAYMCELKETSKGQMCDCRNVNGGAIDKMICDQLLSYEDENSAFRQYLVQLSDVDKQAEDYKQRIRDCQKTIDKNKAAISRLLRSLPESSEITAEYINNEISALDAEIKAEEANKAQLEQLKNDREYHIEAIKKIENELSYFKENFDVLSADEKRGFIRDCVGRVVWNDGAGTASVFPKGR